MLLYLYFMRSGFITLFLLLSIGIASAQKEVESQRQLWSTVSFHVPVKKDRLLVMLEERHFLENPATSTMYYIQGKYTLNHYEQQNWKFSMAAGAYQFIYTTFPDIKRPFFEYRFYPEIHYQPQKDLGFNLRVENRYLRFESSSSASGAIEHEFRLRPMIQVWKKWKLTDKTSIKAYNRFYIQHSVSKRPLYFDQNRVYLGFSSKLNQRYTLSYGYLYWFQNGSSVWLSRHSLLLNFGINLKK